MEHSEATLVIAARNGDQQAFADLISLHRAKIWAVCLNITGNAHDAEDALQVALLNAWRNLDRFQGTSRFSTWLYRIASNEALSLIRRRKPNTQLADFTDPLEEPNLAADTAIHLDERVALQDALRDALAQLSTKLREAVVLRDVSDFTYDEIAEHQGISVQTVKSRIHRGRTELAGLLRDHITDSP